MSDLPKDIKTLAETLVKLAAQKNIKIATAESCTGGGIGQAVTAIAGSSAVYEGGIISYSNAVKASVLGIPNEILEFYGAVSEPVASAMAMQARDMLGADISVSVTGIAGPGGGNKEKPVGMVCFGIASAAATHTQTQQFGDLGRGQVRMATIRHALSLLIDAIRQQ